MKNMKRKLKLRQVLSLALAAMLTFSLAACGNSGGDTENGNGNGNGSGDSVGTEGFVWVPSYMQLPVDEESYIGNISFIGTDMYYSYTTYGEVRKQEFRSLDLTNPDAKPVVLYAMEDEEQDPEAEFATYISNLAASGDGGVLLVVTTYPIITNYDDPNAWERQRQQTTYVLQKVGADGSEIFSVDITEYLRKDMDNSYLQYIMANEEGRIYCSNGSTWLWVFEADGTYAADIKLSEDSWSWLRGIGFLTDGRLAILQNGNSGDPEIRIYDEEKKAFSDAYENLPPRVYNSGISAGPEGSILLEGESTLYAYDPETQTYTELLQWMQSDMNPDYVDNISMLDEETIAVYYRDWNTDENSIVLLKKTPASEVVQKQILVLGCMGLGQNLQSAVVAFNKSNEEYRIEIKDYSVSVDWSQENAYDVYQNAQTQLNNDILTGNAPDLFAATDINLKLFAEKGVIEDLSPYLENSSVVSRDDLITPVLDAYTNSGILCTIPTSFSVATLLGRTSEVGDQTSWTLDEMIAYAEQYPDAALFAYASRYRVRQYCLIYDFDSYVNWETGECSFDSDEFKKVLELAKQYPEEADYSESLPKQIGSHRALLYDLNMYDFQELQLARLMFGEQATPIGYPSANGTGVVVSGTGGVCISASSKNKDACWAFIESMLTEEALSSNRFMWGFPILQSAFDSKLEEAMVPNYQLDENGEPVLDENGEPIEWSNHSYGWDDMTFDLYSVSEEDAATIREIINRISSTMDYDEQILSIIEEESDAYFAGQKNVDDVAKIIQSRVQTYVNESR
ncbi:MAG: extracellular solute-binding protein [Lachnospiraceae bacterium]|nr:extracellular solute-binding protein [Lachnospiraceae bacterium]